MLVCLVGRDRGWSLRSTPGSVLSPRSGWACRNLVVVARGGRSESGERQGGSGWWPVEASPCRAEALGWTGTQGSRCATNPGLGKNVPSGHGGAGAVAVHPRFLAPPSNGNRAETGVTLCLYSLANCHKLFSHRYLRHFPKSVQNTGI
jgi:hypothetical protein